MDCCALHNSCWASGLLHEAEEWDLDDFIDAVFKNKGAKEMCLCKIKVVKLAAKFL